MSRSLDIVIPVYNEGENIITAIELIFQKLKPPYRIIVVYDFDGDSTVPVLNNYLAKNQTPAPIILHKNTIGRGALNAIKSGMHYASAEFVVVTMADLSDPPEVINHMMDIAEKDHADIICASRYMKGGAQIGGPLFKKTLSRLAGVSLKYLAGAPTHDVTNSFKLYRKSFLNETTIESTGGFELGMELVVKGWIQGKVIREVPTIWQDRSNGQSNFKLIEWLPNYLKWYFQGMNFGLKNLFFSHNK